MLYDGFSFFLTANNKVKERADEMNTELQNLAKEIDGLLREKENTAEKVKQLHEQNVQQKQGLHCIYVFFMQKHSWVFSFDLFQLSNI